MRSTRTTRAPHPRPSSAPSCACRWRRSDHAERRRALVRDDGWPRRLAVDTNYRGRELGYGLLRDALLRTLQVARQAGIRAVLLHAMTSKAKRFYLRAGFYESPLDPMTMMIAIADVEKALETP